MRYLLLLALFILPVSSFAQCMSGTYTIGGASPDYATIGQAVNALYNNGVCGPVVFDIRNGTYIEQLTIYSIPGTSATNTITFQSESGDSSLVTIEYASTPVNTFVLRLNGCDYITFRKIGIHNTSNANPTVFDLISTRCTRIQNCKIWAPMQGTTNDALIYASYCDSVIVDRNSMTGSWMAYFPFTCRHQYVTNNIMANQLRYALRLANVGSLNFDGNTISSVSTSANYISIYITGSSDTLSVSANKITTPRIAMSVTNAQGDSTRPLRFYNNMISSSVNYDCVSLGTGCAYIDFCHNTINSSGDEAVLNLASSAGMNIVNNIFNSSGGGVVYKLSSANTALIDYNIVNAANDSVARINTSTSYYPDFQLWQSQYGRDLHSVYAVPQFVSSSDLHVTSDFSQNMLCPTIDTLSVDVDGDLRDVNSPYPGADEFSNVGLTVDAGSLYLRFSNVPTCSGTPLVSVTLRNYGTQVLNSCMINWSINSAPQAPVNWSGSLAPWDTVLVALGTLTTMSHAAYDVIAWTTAPNSQADPFPINDSLAQFSFLTSFSGNYTIGGVAPDFATFNDAVNDLELYGVCGPVTFFVRDGMYNEQFEINTLRGSSSANQVRFTAESGDSSLVLLYFNSDSAGNNHIARLNDCQYINFDHLTFRKDGSTYSSCIFFENGADHCSVSHCRFFTTFSGNNVDNGSLIYSSRNAGRDEYNIISFCGFEGGYSAITILGTTSSSDEAGNHIMNCFFLNQEYSSVELEFQDNLNFSRNTIENTTTNNLDHGIYVRSPQNNVVLSNNKITGNFWYGMSLTSCNWTLNPNPVRVINNMIAITGTSTQSIRGILAQSSTGEILFAFNTINIYGVTSGICLKTNGCWYVNIYNNNFCSTTSGYVTGVNIDISQLSGCVLDHNNYFGADQFVEFDVQNLIYYSISALNIDGYEMNGVSMDPLYTSPTDLHVNQPLLCGTGMNIPGITDDFDGDFRSALPTIGADEIAGPVSAIQHSASGCAPQTVQFNAGGSPSLYTFSWDFGDPTTTSDVSSLPNPQYTYTNLGTYTVTLHMTGTSSCGGSDSTFVILNLTNNAPTVTFSGVLDTVCLQDAPWFLSGALPLGGTYSGTGVSGGFFSPNVAGAGDEVISYVYTDTSGCSDSATFTINVDLCAGVYEQTAEPEFNVYPNPASEEIMLVLSSCGGPYSVEIVNALGETVMKEAGNCTTDSAVLRVDIRDLSGGLYQVRVSMEGEVLVRAFVCE